MQIRKHLAPMGVILIFVALALPVFAVAKATDYRTIHEHEAKRETATYMHKNSAKWRYRDSGHIDCRNGRLNRYTWACRIVFSKGTFCARGRVNVIKYAEEGTVYLSAQFNGRPC